LLWSINFWTDQLSIFETFEGVRPRIAPCKRDFLKSSLHTTFQVVILDVCLTFSFQSGRLLSNHTTPVNLPTQPQPFIVKNEKGNPRVASKKGVSLMSEVQVGQVRLSYEVRGHGSPVVNINGTGRSAELWWQLGLGQKLLDAGFQVTAFDNRGIPPSDVPPPPYSVPQMAQDAIGLLEHLDCGPYILNGSSLGGLITQTVALQRPDSVHAAVFNFGCGNYSTFIRPFFRSWVELLEKGYPPHSVIGALMLPVFIPPTQWANNTAVDEALKIISAFLPKDTAGLLGQYHANLLWSKEDHVKELSGLKMPALAIANEYDMAFPPALVKEAVSRMPKGEYVEILGAAHASFNPNHQQQRDSAILQFLSRHAPSSHG
jgi:pimeloyl-ACP methyl ester carboxylesterase